MKTIDKIFCIILIVLMVSLLASCSRNSAEGIEITSTTLPKVSETASTTLPTETIPEPTKFVVPKWFTDYSSIIEEYRRFAACELLNDDSGELFDYNIFSEPTSDEALGEHWGYSIPEAKVSSLDFPKSREAFGYALNDLNKDGIDELVLLLSDYTVIAAFSKSEGKPKLLDAFWSRYKCGIDSDGILYVNSNGGAIVNHYNSYRISKNDSELTLIESFAHDAYEFEAFKTPYGKLVGGEWQSINRNEFNKLIKNFPVHDKETAIKLTKSSGLKFISLFD